MDTKRIDGLQYIGHLTRAHPDRYLDTENPSASQVAESLERGAKDYFVRQSKTGIDSTFNFVGPTYGLSN